LKGTVASPGSVYPSALTNVGWGSGRHGTLDLTQLDENILGMGNVVKLKIKEII
jgi:hypothetical protein